MPYNQADAIFKSNLKHILYTGTSTEGYPVRPRWEDGKEAHTKFVTNIVNEYDLSKEFPAGTLRKLAFKSCVDEILWIWQKKSNNIKDLNSHVWDSWADSQGSIGKAYGWQVANHLRKVTGQIRTGDNERNFIYYLDQTDYIIHELINNPFSRRIIGMLYNIDDLRESALDACCYSVTYMVRIEKSEKVLDCVLNQRSNDFIVANNWNVCQYAVLQHMLARVTGIKVGKLTHVIANAHIYDRHESIAKELLARKSYNAPKLWINPTITDFYKFTVDDFQLIGYEHGEPIKNIPVAV